MYTEHFPHFPAADLPAIPAHWRDVTDASACCPTYCASARGDGTPLVLVYVDFPCASDRYSDAEKRFGIAVYVGHPAQPYTEVYASDVWADILTRV